MGLNKIIFYFFIIICYNKKSTVKFQDNYYNYTKNKMGCNISTPSGKMSREQLTKIKTERLGMCPSEHITIVWRRVVGSKYSTIIKCFCLNFFLKSLKVSFCLNFL